MTSARDMAVMALRDREGNVTAHLERRLGSCGLSPADAALARELALGVVRRRATLDAVLRAFLQQPNRRLPGALNEILYVALYQILFLDRIPQFAILNEAVEQAANFHHRRQGGLVNGLLRSVTRSLSQAQAGPVPPARDVVPSGPGHYRQMDRPVFADPASSPAAYLAQAYSLPEELAARWIARFGSLTEATAIAHHCNARPPLTLRVNSRITDPAAVVAELAVAGVPAAIHANGVSVVLSEPCNVTGLEVFRRGAVQPQDASATGIVLAAAPRPGMKVLDVCASPGTKTTHLAELMRNEGSIIATDVNQEKIGRIHANCRRMGVTIIETVLAEELGRLDVRSFDLVLADVPCSNTGVLARRAEARWRFDSTALSRLVADQKFLIQAAAQFVRPGGRLVYSTCSIEPEEDAEMARWLGATQSRMRRVEQVLTLPAGADDPTRWYDGGYLAVFEAQ